MKEGEIYEEKVHNAAVGFFAGPVAGNNLGIISQPGKTEDQRDERAVSFSEGHPQICEKS